MKRENLRINTYQTLLASSCFVIVLWISAFSLRNGVVYKLLLSPGLASTYGHMHKQTFRSKSHWYLLASFGLTDKDQIEYLDWIEDT